MAGEKKLPMRRCFTAIFLIRTSLDSIETCRNTKFRQNVPITTLNFLVKPMTERMINKEEMCNHLKDLGIPFERVDHPAVFTCAESHLVPPLEGADTKNLFLRDNKGKRYFLVTVPHSKAVDCKALGRQIGAGPLSFGSPERLREMLGVEPGSVTLLATINDSEGRVKVYLDESFMLSNLIQCHPLENTATLVIGREQLFKFLESNGHKPEIINVPSRET
mgnify:CR=1 FL=1